VPRGKQIDFPPNQKQIPGLDRTLWIIAIACIVCDAVHDRSFTVQLLDAMRRRRRAKGNLGEIRFRPAAALRNVTDDEREQLQPSVSRAEQSNSSIIYGNRFILKLFRKVAEGVNPDLEISRFLTERARFPHTPGLAGWIEQHSRRDEPRTLGMMQMFVANEGDAWQHTLFSLSQYFEQALTRGHKGALGAEPTTDGRQRTADDNLPRSLLDAAEQIEEQGSDVRSQVSGNSSPDTYHLTPDTGLSEDHPRNLIGPYLQSASLLGQRTAEMHLALALDHDDPAFAPEPFTMHQNRSVYQSMRNLTRQTIRMMRRWFSRYERRIESGDERMMRAIDAARTITAQEQDILAVFQRILDIGLAGRRIRIHGDYHLGQVLYTGRNFLIIDFEGEPARPLSERRMKRSPLRDVAGMLRSFDYAAYTAIKQHCDRFGISKDDDVANLRDWAETWRTWVGATFLRSYLDHMGSSDLLPKSQEQLAMMLDCFLLEKAVYELQYELNNRPEWIGIPIDGIGRLLHSGVQT
jgi:maltose alpha-D-glucosyltransferase / alpha-amylase